MTKQQPQEPLYIYEVRTTPETVWQVTRRCARPLCRADREPRIVFAGYDEYQGHCVAQALQHYHRNESPPGELQPRYIVTLVRRRQGATSHCKLPAERLVPPIPAGPIYVDAALAALRAEPGSSAPEEPRAFDLLRPAGGGWSPACQPLLQLQNLHSSVRFRPAPL